MNLCMCESVCVYVCRCGGMYVYMCTYICMRCMCVYMYASSYISLYVYLPPVDKYRTPFDRANVLRGSVETALEVSFTYPISVVVIIVDLSSLKIDFNIFPSSPIENKALSVINIYIDR